MKARRPRKVVVGICLGYGVVLVLALLAYWGPEPKSTIEAGIKPVFSIRISPRGTHACTDFSLPEGDQRDVREVPADLMRTGSKRTGPADQHGD